mgnify:CR=1 FL=1
MKWVMAVGFDLTPFLNFGGENVIALRTDNDWSIRSVRLEVCSSGMIEISMPIMEEYLKMYGCTLLINYTRPCLYTVIYRLQGLTSMHPILR